MGIFSLSFIKWDSDNQTMIWKFPETNISSFSQLIVYESQEACLLSKGRLIQKFGPGNYTITNENIPGFKVLYGIPFGGKNPLLAEVWFVNKTTPLNIKWGTSVPILLEDPIYKIIIPIIGFGQFGIKIRSAENFIIKIVGNLTQFSQQDIVQYFRGIYMKNINTIIAKYVINNKLSVLQLPAYLNELSKDIEVSIQKEFEDYGLQLSNFNIEMLSPKEEEPSVVELKNALSEKAKMDIIGYSYNERRQFDVLDKAATSDNSTGNSFVGMGVGIGAGFGIGGAVNKIAEGIYVTEKTIKCKKCGTDINEKSTFCPKCGVNIQSVEVTENKLKKVVCDKCGISFEANNKYCPNCGDIYNPCHYCGTDNPENATVCISCGKSMPILCSKCKSKNSSDAIYCSECGSLLKKKCKKCDDLLSDGVNFCPKCGEKYEKQ